MYFLYVNKTQQFAPTEMKPFILYFWEKMKEHVMWFEKDKISFKILKIWSDNITKEIQFYNIFLLQYSIILKQYLNALCVFLIKWPNVKCIGSVDLSPRGNEGRGVLLKKHLGPVDTPEKRMLLHLVSPVNIIIIY